ncbi:MAG: hypothetical protein ACRDJI_07320 [Actinomycetota bacterium]
MKTKLLVGALGAVMALAPTAGARVLGPQKYSGQVIVPTPHPQDTAICFQGVVRRVNMASQGVYNGPVFGQVFDIDKATWGGKFKLTIKNHATGQEDIDIYFFSTFGPPIIDDPSMNTPTILAQFQERNTKGEAGLIPETTTKAIACLYNGLAADFDYVGLPKKK